MSEVLRIFRMVEDKPIKANEIQVKKRKKGICLPWLGRLQDVESVSLVPERLASSI